VAVVGISVDVPVAETVNVVGDVTGSVPVEVAIEVEDDVGSESTLKKPKPLLVEVFVASNSVLLEEIEVVEGCVEGEVDGSAVLVTDDGVNVVLDSRTTSVRMNNT
jgi:hypothetical protein